MKKPLHIAFVAIRILMCSQTWSQNSADLKLKQTKENTKCSSTE
jgi:hypothetical protein